MLQHFIIEGKYLGSVERKFELTRGAFPYSMLFFCEKCGDVFAKFPIEGRPWLANRLLCKKCPTDYPQFHLPGSIWMSWEEELNAALPLPVLMWEIQRELDCFERLQNGET